MLPCPLLSTGDKSHDDEVEAFTSPEAPSSLVSFVQPEINTSNETTSLESYPEWPRLTISPLLEETFEGSSPTSVTSSGSEVMPEDSTANSIDISGTHVFRFVSASQP